MAYSDSQKRATAKYMKNNLDDIKLRVPKGDRDKIKTHAENQGMSLNAYILKLIEDDMSYQPNSPEEH